EERMALIENPILNSPFREPTRHFKFDDEGITNEILNGRLPIPLRSHRPRKEKREAAPVRNRMDAGSYRAEPARGSDQGACQRVADRRIRRRHGRDFTAPFVLDA